MNPQQNNGQLPPDKKPLESYGDMPGSGQPFAPPSTQPPPPHNPVEQYDFIMNPAASPKPGLISSGLTLKRVGLAVLGILLLIIVVVIAFSALKSGGANTASMVPVLQQQTELIRIATAGETAAHEQKTKELAYAVQLSITSAKQQMSAYLTQNKQKVDSKTLTLKHSALADTQLASAKANSTYDSTFIRIIQDDLASYKQALHTAYVANPGAKGRKLLNNQYEGAKLLLQQSGQQ